MTTLELKPALITIKPLTTLLAAVLLLSGCGGGGSNNADTTTPRSTTSVNDGTGNTGTGTTGSTHTITLNGRVMNVGYLANTAVCLDQNDDGLCGTGEPATVTDNEGRYMLTTTKGYRGASLLAKVTASSLDTGASDASSLAIGQGWTLATLLEYPDGATAVELNISPLSATYYARTRLSGRNRLSNDINVVRRLLAEPSINLATNSLILSANIDYVAHPQNNFADRLRTLHTVLDDRAQATGAPLDMLTTTAVLYSWYNSYTNASASAAVTAADPAKINTYANTDTNSPAVYLARDYRYFRPRTDANLQFRRGLTETAGWLRATGKGELAALDRRLLGIRNGAMLQQYEHWENNLWTPLTIANEPSFSLGRNGDLIVVNATDDQQPRTINNIDGNRVTFRVRGNQFRLAYDIANSPGTHFFIEEWVDEQRSYSTYYNGIEPATPPFTAAPACVQNYPDTPQPTASNVLTSTSISNWYRACFDYYLAEYYDVVKGDLQLTYQDPNLPGANFYDVTLLDAVTVFPATQNCGTDANPMATVSLNGIDHCNWAVDANGDHTLADLFNTNGVAINSWNLTYGESTFTVDGAPLTAGTPEQAGLPQQLILTLNRSGNATSGTGTLTSPYGAWTATSNTALTETVEWSISAENPQLVLINMPFRDVNNPRVPANMASDGVTPASSETVLGRSGHLTASWNSTSFDLRNSTHSSINYRKLAIALVNGHFIAGQYYGKGYTYSERYFTTPAMTQGMDAMNYVFGKLYNAGFVD